MSRLSRGFAPVSYEELEAPISGNALQLLLRIRRDADQRETDGAITTRHLDALAVAHGMADEDKQAGLAELTKARLVRPKHGGYLDVNFLQWCRPAEKREARRAQWRTYNKKRPHAPTTVVTTVATTPLEAEAEKEKEKETKAEKEEQQLAPLADSKESTMPTQEGMIDLSNAWVRLSGKQPSSEDVHYFARWLDMFGDRLSTQAIIQELERLFARQSKAGNPIAKAKYCDDAIRTLHEAAVPRRREEARGEGEPPVETGSGYVSIERVNGARQALGLPPL